MWTGIADQTFDEEIKISKLRTVIPMSVYNFIALEARKCKRYDELVQLVEAQTMDPITGVMRGERDPGLSALNHEQQQEAEDKWNKEELEQYLSAAGVDCNSLEGAWLLNDLGKGKRKGKRKGKGNANCFNC